MTDTITPPEGLSETVLEWWESLTRDFELEPRHLRVATVAAQQWDRMQEAGAALAEHGLVYEDRFGAPHARPEAKIEKGASFLCPPNCSRPGARASPKQRPFYGKPRRCGNTGQVAVNRKRERYEC